MINSFVEKRLQHMNFPKKIRKNFISICFVDLRRTALLLF